VVVPDIPARIPDGIDFGVGSGIMGFQHRIVSFSQKLAVSDDHCPERPPLPLADGMKCLLNGHFQIEFPLRHSGKLLK
jgi:hypothetical protein